MKTLTIKLTTLALLITLTLSITPYQVWANNEAPSEIPLKVYEHVELVSLIMRLADFQEYSDEMTEYQQSLRPAFEEFADHPAVEFARYLRFSAGIGFDAPIIFAIHLEYTEGQFQLMQDSDIWELDDRWTPETAERFLELLNDFYIDSGFASFFEAHTPYFEEHSQRLADQLLSRINFDWFYQFGFGPEYLRVIVYPSGAGGGYGPTQLGRVSYAVLPGSADYGDLWMLEFAVHEFAHSFANDIAAAWYEENEEFRRMSYDSVDLVRMPFYSHSLIMAFEYATRAYTILYMVENHDVLLCHQLLGEITRGFPYIEAVFAMITEHETIFTPDTDILALILGENLEYELEEKQQAVIDGDYLLYYILDLAGAELSLEDFEHNNNQNVVAAQTGDVFLFLNEYGHRYLVIDLGENMTGREWGLPEGQFRKNSIFPLDDEDSYTIAMILGEDIEYTLGEQQRFAFSPTRTMYYQAMNLLNMELTAEFLQNFSPNRSGHLFGTQTGDALIVTEEGNRYLLIDFGPHPRGVEWGHEEGLLRWYSAFPLDLFARNSTCLSQ